MFDEYKSQIESILKEQGISTSIRILTPPNPELGDFCFVVNQIAGKADPLQLAEDLLPKLKSLDDIETVSVFSTGKKKKIAYLNFKIKSDALNKLRLKLSKSILELVYSKEYGYLDINQGKTVLVEHTSANPISPLHVGNLRNSVQGDTFARILERTGYTVYRHFYVNDVGLQIGFVVVGYELATRELGLKPPIKIDLWTGQIYAIMNCFYTIQKIKLQGKQRGIQVSSGYSLSADEVDALTSKINKEIDSLDKQISPLLDISKPNKSQKIQLHTLKIAKTKLEKEISDIHKYYQTFNDLQSRFPEFFEKLYQAVSEIDLIQKVSEYILAYESNSDERITQLFREVVNWVLDAFKWTLKRYNITFDQFDFESEVTWSGLPTQLIDQLAQTEYAVVEGKAIRYRFPKQAMNEFCNATGIPKKALPIRGDVPELQLRRSDGTALYAAKDIAYTVKKYEDRKPEKIYNVISVEQSLPQFQLLLPLHQLGMTHIAKSLKHYAYENVELRGRTMSGRLAKYITADSFYDETYIRARMAKRASDGERGILPPKTEDEWKLEDKILHAVTLASTRFPLIETDPKKRIELDLDRELDFKRNSGPFVQYAHARANSLISRVQQRKGWTPTSAIDFSYLVDHDSMTILNHLETLHDQLKLSADEENPAKIATWVFKLAQLFMKYYEKYPILKSENPEAGKARLSLIYAIKRGLATGLEILGIPPAPRL